MDSYINLPGKIAIAVSGGSDSMALCLLANEWAKKSGKEVIALTVDHKLRPESAQEAEQVHSWLKKYNIEHLALENEDEAIPQSNIQEYARDLRYKLMGDWCNANHAPCLLTAHNAEDQAETVLLRLERGTGLDGLTGINNDTQINDLRILRPVMDFYKEELKNYLVLNQQEWIEDPTNSNKKYKRNALRLALSELAQDKNLLTSRINKTSATLAKVSEALDYATDCFISQMAQGFEEGYVRADLQKILNLPEEFTLRILKRILLHVGGKKRAPRFEELENLLKKLKSGFTGTTIWGCYIAQTQEEKIIVLREKFRIKTELLELGKELFWDDRYIISLHKKSDLSTCYIRNFSNTEIKSIISSLSYFEQKKIQQGIPKSVLETLPILVENKDSSKVENVIAAPHINYYRDEKIKQFVTCQFAPRIQLTKDTIVYCPEDKIALI